MTEDAHGGAIEGVDTLVRRAGIADKVILATIAGFALVLIGELLEMAGVIDLLAFELTPLATAYVFVSLVSIAVYIASVIFVAMWIHRAHSNLLEAGVDGLNYTPGWAVGWYFIPFANLFVPFKAMQELWTKSHGASDNFAADPPSTLGMWWGAWIIGNIAGNISTRMGMMGDGSNNEVAIVLAASSSVCLIASAYFLRQIIREITSAQESATTIAKVFE